MRVSILITLTIFLFNCGDKTEVKNNIETSETLRTKIIVNEEGRNFLMPHLLEMDLTNVSFNEEIYSSIDEIKTYAEEFREAGFEEETKIAYREGIISKVGDIINNNQELPGDSHTALNDFMMPLHEMTDYVNESMESQMFNARIDEFVNYLSNFAILFPKK